MAVNSANSIDEEVLVVEQEKFYQDRIGLLMLLTLLLLVSGTMILGIIVMLRKTALPPPTYFSATDIDQLISEAPLEQTGIGTNVLFNWITEAMMNCNTYNFISHAKVIDSASLYFTPEGYETYKNALTEAKIVDKVVNEKLILKAVPSDAPQILLEKPFAGRYMWKIKIPMKFRYQNVTTDITDQIEINLIVMRVPTTQSPLGISILKFEMEEINPMMKFNQSIAK